jgi:3-hydroxyacyl-CoA dehydrogenase
MPSDQVRALIDAQRAAKTLPPDQIADLLLTAVLNEALELYKKGFVPRVSDLDLATVQALGFPADQGGVIFAAQRRGLFALRSRMAHIVGPDHRFWRPHRLWRRAAEAGEDLYDLPRFPTSLERRAARRSRMRQQAAG